MIQVANIVARDDQQQQKHAWGYNRKNNSCNGYMFVTNVTCYHYNKIGHIAKNCCCKSSDKTKFNSFNKSNMNGNSNSNYIKTTVQNKSYKKRQND